MSTAARLTSNLRELAAPAVTSTDDRLVQECLDGNEQAWSELINKYKRLIYSIPVKYGMDQESAAEIFQAVCVELFCELRNVRKVESLKWWLVSVAAHKCLQWKKKRQAETDIEEVDQRVIPADALSASDLLEQANKEQSLRDAIAILPSRCRELIHLLFFEHPPVCYAEAAKKLGLATGSIGFIRGRCLNKLEKQLIELGF